jgi:hypothetical protein
MMTKFPLKTSELTYWIFRASQLGELLSIEQVLRMLEKR